MHTGEDKDEERRCRELAAPDVGERTSDDDVPVPMSMSSVLDEEILES